MSSSEPRNNNEVLNMDAFSDGQMRSKLWLCRELEKRLDPDTFHTIWIYGAWYGTLAFLLLSRDRIKVNKIHLFDIDPEAIRIARKVLDGWFIQNTVVELHEKDCLSLNVIKESQELGGAPDIIINTSCEHFENSQWMQLVPRGTTLVLQSTDMRHPTHIQRVESIYEMKNQMQMREIVFEGTYEFHYETFDFKRFMLIGKA